MPISQYLGVGFLGWYSTFLRVGAFNEGEPVRGGAHRDLRVPVRSMVLSLPRRRVSARRLIAHTPFLSSQATSHSRIHPYVVVTKQLFLVRRTLHSHNPEFPLTSPSVSGVEEEPLEVTERGALAHSKDIHYSKCHIPSILLANLPHTSTTDIGFITSETASFPVAIYPRTYLRGRSTVTPS